MSSVNSYRYSLYLVRTSSPAFRYLLFLGLRLILAGDLLLDLRGYGFVVAELHREAALAAGYAFQLRLVLHDLRQRRLRLHHGHPAAEEVLPLDSPTLAGQVTRDRAHLIFGNCNFH